MLLGAFSLYDRKALVYSTPFFAVNDPAAIRSVTDLAGDLNTTVGRHPADFVLFRVGSWDDSKGLLLAESPVRHVIDVQSVAPAAHSPMSLFNGEKSNGNA